MKKKLGAGVWQGGKSLAALLLVLAIAFAIILGADKLEKRYALRFDLSYNGITSQGELTNQVLDQLEKDVHAYVLFSPGQEDKSLIGLLERYAARTLRFTYSLENLALKPNLAKSISSSLDDNAVSSDSLILHCKDTDRTRVLDGSQYISQAYDPASESIYIAGLKYEKSLTEAILYVSANKLPQIQLLMGQGELTRADTQAMELLLKQYSFSFREVALARGDSLKADELLMVLSPQKDLTEPQLKQLHDFAATGGAFFFTDDFSSAPALQNFAALYRSYGFEKLPGLVVADAEQRGSYYDSPAVLIPEMLATPATEALVAAKQSSLLLAGAAPFAEPRNAVGLQTTVMLRSGPSYLSAVTDAFEGIDKQPGDPEGRFPLALLADKAFEDGRHSRAFIIGNSSLFTDSWMQQNTYSAELLLNIIHYLRPDSGVQLDIMPKDAIRPPLQISSPALVSLVLVALPFGVLAVAAPVLLRRRRD